ncbi:MAG: YicC family protein [Clostridia bacterium]|nr:YicC family protein [Clostridia bacterium]MBO5913780.1 YicC family protein [Clostridia bacterium]
MIKSMTGYGRHREVIDGRDILCEVKSVNSRYLDTNIKLGRLYNALEEKVKQYASTRVSRGKMDIYISIENIAGDDNGLSVNEKFLESYVALLRDIKDRYSLGGDVTIQTVAGRNEVFVTTRPDEDTEAAGKALLVVMEKAFDSFTAMREEEGKKLEADLLSHLSVLEGIREFIVERAPLSVKENNERMKARIKELLEGAEYDEQRLLTECAVFADKADISEELARLDSHFSQFKKILKENVPVGRKLDFLVQEMNREVNTIGSKCNDGEVARQVIEAKSYVEKIREQIQNIE